MCLCLFVRVVFVSVYWVDGGVSTGCAGGVCACRCLCTGLTVVCPQGVRAVSVSVSVSLCLSLCLCVCLVSVRVCVLG